MKKKFKIGGMTCSACASSVEKAVQKLDGVRSCSVNLATSVMYAECEDIADADIIRAVESAGYSVLSEKKDKPSGSEEREETDKMLRRFIASAILLIPLMYLSMGHMLKLPMPGFLHGAENAGILAFLQFLFTLPILYINRGYFISGFKKLIKRSPNMDTLIAVGSGAAALYGIFSVFMILHALGGNDLDTASMYAMDLYFESAAMILTLVTLGKYFETRAKARTNDSVRKLLSLAPKFATVLRGGEEMQVPAGSVLLNDIVIVRAGESIAVDGTVMEGSGTVDQAAVTGESLPILKEKGSKVICGTINTDGYLKISAEKIGGETTLSKIVQLVEETASSKAPIAKLADSISGIFVPIVMSISLIVFIAWLIAGYGLAFSLGIAIAVLVISCPCALGLATPLAIMVGTGKGAEHGILIRSGESLEQLGKITTVVFDKTGTLTEGTPKVVSVLAENERELMRVAASLEKASLHPLAVSICEYAEERGIPLSEVTEFKNTTGKGVSGVVGGKEYFVGSRRFLSELSVGAVTEATAQDGEMSVYVASGGKVIGEIRLKDRVKETTVACLKQLRSMGVKVKMLTGDSLAVARSLADSLSLDGFAAELLPGDKSDEIAKMKRMGEVVAMVGDGINDAVALTAADVGIAVSGSTDIAASSSDLILLNNDLGTVVTAIKLSKKVIGNIKQNLFWAFLYNVIGIPIAAGVLYPFFGIKLSPMIAALAMSLSSLFVVLNSLRLKFFGKSQRRESGKLLIGIDGMSCSHCSSAVSQALTAVEGVKTVKVSLSEKKAEVEFDVKTDRKKLKDAIKKAGYTVTHIQKL